MGYRGVSKTVRNSWVARVNAGDGEQLYLGTFETEVDAAKAYDRVLTKVGLNPTKANFPGEILPRDFCDKCGEPVFIIQIKSYAAKVPVSAEGILEEHTWSISGHRDRGTKYLRNVVSKKSMHRLLVHSTADVDHIDGNGLNNCFCNLRAATKSQNSMNKCPIKKRGDSKYKGVCRNKKNWSAQITLQKKKRHLGTFTHEIDAAKAYNEAATKYFGEFARLNIIEEDNQTMPP